MVTRSQASSKPAKRQPTRHQPKEVEVVVIEDAEAPTQAIQSRITRKASKPTASTEMPKTHARAAKKRGIRNVPPPQPAEEEHDEEMGEEGEESEDEHQRTPKRRRRASTDGPRATLEEKRLGKEIKRVVQKARESGWGLRALRRQVIEVTGARAPARDGEDEGEEVDEGVPIKHHKKERIGPKERKKPSAWTDDEQAVLVNLVCDHGAQWSKFEHEYGGNKLYGRNQTALKDKARNIMRKIIDNDQEEEWITRYPNWAQVTVGQARRGVHAYQNGQIPVRGLEKELDEMVEA